MYLKCTPMNEFDIPKVETSRKRGVNPSDQMGDRELEPKNPPLIECQSQNDCKHGDQCHKMNPNEYYCLPIGLECQAGSECPDFGDLTTGFTSGRCTRNKCEYRGIATGWQEPKIRQKPKSSRPITIPCESQRDCYQPDICVKLLNGNYCLPHKIKCAEQADCPEFHLKPFGGNYGGIIPGYCNNSNCEYDHAEMLLG